MGCENLYVEGNKPGGIDAWKLCIERLSNAEFDWDPNSYTVYVVEGPTPHILPKQVIMAIKHGKAAGTSLIIA